MSPDRESGYCRGRLKNFPLYAILITGYFRLREECDSPFKKKHQIRDRFSNYEKSSFYSGYFLRGEVFPYGFSAYSFRIRRGVRHSADGGSFHPYSC